MGTQQQDGQTFAGRNSAAWGQGQGYLSLPNNPMVTPVDTPVVPHTSPSCSRQSPPASSTSPQSPPGPPSPSSASWPSSASSPPPSPSSTLSAPSPSSCPTSTGCTCEVNLLL